MECSESTARRILSTLRDKIGAPIEYNREQNGYYYNQAQRQTYELPGLWLNSEELYALLISYSLLDALQPNVLNGHIQPLKQRIENILQHQHAGSPDLTKYIRIFQLAARPTDINQFRRIAGALVEHRQMRVLYHGRERDQTSERTISPQRLIYYRSNWYLDAWCHMRKSLRTFSLDRLHLVEILDKNTHTISSSALDAHFTTAYGIFAGQPKHTAELRFTPTAARWVADEHWHPDQQGKVFSDGSYLLTVPYNDPRELVMDILKYGAEVEVLAPDVLRDMVREKLREALNNYE